MCEQWYAASASAQDLNHLACMARAADRDAWSACRVVAPPPEPASNKVELQVAATQQETAEDAGISGALGDSSKLDHVVGSASPSSDLKGAIDGQLGASVGSAAAVDEDQIIFGSLAKSVITAVIQRHIGQMRYCYNRELSKNPDLAGMIDVKFDLAKDGTVSSVDIVCTTMGNSLVENCIDGVFMGMHFPEPKGGGIVRVTYPLVFQPGP